MLYAVLYVRVNRFIVVVLVPSVVSAVVAVTAMRVLLFVWDGSILRECEGDDNAGVVPVSTRGSGTVSSVDDVLKMSGEGGVCVICLARGGR